MSTTNGVQSPWPPAPVFAKPKAQAPAKQAKPAAQPGSGDQAAISGDAKKKPMSSERRDLIDGLKTNYGGNDRIQTKESKLNTLTDDQLKSVKKKRDFDKALTKHEEDHHTVAADLARSGPLYETKVGEDGETYRTSGKVMIDTGTTEDDEKTVKKMKQVRAAALAPDGNQLAPLSEQDKKVAGEASEKERKAQLRLDAKQTGKEVPDSAKKEDGKKGGSTF